MKKLFCFSGFLLILLNCFFSEEILSNQNYTWTNVLSGKIISEPVVTNYGICALTDAKTITAISSGGTVLWEKNTGKISSPITGVFEEDFIFLISGRKKLTLLNPSGSEIWTINVPFEILENPFEGRDGRFFLRGKNQLACYGMNGICKWNLKTAEQSDIKIEELPDGSLLLFLKKLQDGKTQGIRVSPFGEILEEITFAGEVIRSEWNKDGILLNFTDGTAGFFSIENNQAKNKWIFTRENKSQGKPVYFAVSDDREKTALLYSDSDSLDVYFLNSVTGKVRSSFSVKEMSSVSKAVINAQGIFITDYTRGAFFNEKGICLWSAVFPSKTSRNTWNYISYTKDNYLILYGTNWSIWAYRVTQNASGKKINQQKNTYSGYYSINTQSFNTIYTTNLDPELISQKRTDTLEKGLYGEKEIQWSGELQSACQEYSKYLSSSDSGARVTKSVFQNDTAGLEKMISQFNLYGTDTFNSCIAVILKKETNRALIKTALNGISQFGYDPDGKLLSALETVMVNAAKKDENLLCSICDSVYSICRFMGRPAYNSKGKNIITTLLYPQYPAKTRDYARDTLKKIAELEL